MEKIDKLFIIRQSIFDTKKEVVKNTIALQQELKIYQEINSIRDIERTKASINNNYNLLKGINEIIKDTEKEIMK